MFSINEVNCNSSHAICACLVYAPKSNVIYGETLVHVAHNSCEKEHPNNKFYLLLVKITNTSTYMVCAFLLAHHCFGI